MSLVPRREVIVALASFAVVATTVAVGTAGTASAAVTDVKVNEIESNGGTPGDWVELYNAGDTVVDISNLVFRDSNNAATYVIPVGTTIAAGGFYVLDESIGGAPGFTFGLGGGDSARLFAADGTTLIDSHAWTAHAVTTYARCPNGTGAFATSTTSTKGGANDCSLPPSSTTTTTTIVEGVPVVKVNEVETSGGVPGDWVEFYNADTAVADISGYRFLDNDISHVQYVIPAGTTIAPGGFFVLDEAAFGFGLGGADSATLFAPDGTTVIDTHSWALAASTTYGRCPDGTGAFVTTTASTKGAANDCSGGGATTTLPGPSGLPWPGDSAVQTVDLPATFTGNLSGLTYEGTGTATPGTLWAARNGIGSLFRLVFDGTNWVPDTANDWGAGKPLLYPNGAPEPDAEGVTIGGPTSADGIYVATERNNAANSISRNSILRFDASASGSTLTATHEWNLTADLPVTGANLGLEAITWIPDTFLVSKGFFDESAGHAYNPAEYPNHGAGLFFVGVEANGTIYAYALDQAGGAFTRIATISSGFVGVMALEFDRDLHDLWAVCDNTCDGRSALLRIVPDTGKFAVSFVFERPAGIVDNLNNEGFAIATAGECVNDRKPVFWADDSDTGGNSIRRGDIPCTALVESPPPEIAEFPSSVVASLIAIAVLGGFFLLVRRRHPI